jgi:hypothetical protein
MIIITVILGLFNGAVLTAKVIWHQDDEIVITHSKCKNIKY